MWLLCFLRHPAGLRETCSYKDLTNHKRSCEYINFSDKYSHHSYFLNDVFTSDVSVISNLFSISFYIAYGFILVLVVI